MSSKIDIKFPDKCRALFSNEYDHVALYGGRGGGKSHSGAGAAVLLATQGYERIVYGRQFQNSIKESSKELVENKIKQYGLSSEFSITQQEIICKSTGSTFLFVGLDRNPNSIKSFEGATLTIIEEAQDIKQHSIDILIPTVFRRTNSRIWWFWNPFSADTPVDTMFRGNASPPNSYIETLSWRDNPYFFDTKLNSERLHLKNTDLVKYRHIWEGEYFDGGEARIFNNVEIADIEVPETIRTQFGGDFGANNDPNVLVKLYVNEKEKWIYIAKEWFGATSVEGFAEGISHIPEIRQYPIIADSAWPQSIATLNTKGYIVKPAKKGSGSVVDGIQWLQGYKIYISPYCPRMREESRLYSWQTDKYTKKILNIPEDSYNHGWDAVRYATEQNRLGVRRIGIIR